MRSEIQTKEDELQNWTGGYAPSEDTPTHFFGREATQEIRLSAKKRAGKYQAGDEVEVKEWEEVGGGTFKGTIWSVNDDGSYDIDNEYGDKSLSVPEDEIVSKTGRKNKKIEHYKVAPGVVVAYEVDADVQTDTGKFPGGQGKAQTDQPMMTDFGGDQDQEMMGMDPETAPDMPAGSGGLDVELGADDMMGQDTMSQDMSQDLMPGGGGDMMETAMDDEMMDQDPQISMGAFNRRR